jgi:hypothetical protein
VALFVGVTALVVVIAGTVMAPDAAAKKPTPPADDDTFTIQLVYYVGIWGDTGEFAATGAINDSGWADVANWPQPELLGDRGTIYIDMHDDGTFTIVGGTGKYRRLAGDGTYTEEWINYGGDPPQWPEPPPDGVLAKGTYILTGVRVD